MGMDLSDLYSPEELSGKRIAFLKRVLIFYTDIIDPIERAQVVGHKLRGTGGNLGLVELSGQGSRLQAIATSRADEGEILKHLEDLRPAIEETINQERARLAG